MKYKKIFSNSRSRKIIITLSVLAISLTTALVLLELFKVTDFYTKTTKNEAATDTKTSINFEPPTEQEKQAGNKRKQEIVSQQTTPEDPKEKPKTEVVIVDAGQYGDDVEVRAFATNSTESGVCLFVFSKSDYPSIKKETAATPGPSTAPCFALSIPRAEFTTTGTWTLEVSYESATRSGKASQELTIQ
jgi:hypothetical protein